MSLAVWRFALCSFGLAIACSGADIKEIVRRGNAALQSDWAADPAYAFIERDEMQKGEITTSRTSQVVMIDGSDYYMPMAVNDKPLPPARQREELRKLKDEVGRRQSEGAGARAMRIAKYRKERDENGALLLEFPHAFEFQLLREEEIDGHGAYVAAAIARARNGPLRRVDKVLSGMGGTVWVDREQFHVIRADCVVISSVPVFGIIAHVLPGTRIEIRMTPVTESVWLVTDFSMTLKLSKLFFVRSTEITHSSYSGYRLNDLVLAELLAKAAE